MTTMPQIIIFGLVVADISTEIGNSEYNKNIKKGNYKLFFYIFLKKINIYRTFL